MIGQSEKSEIEIEIEYSNRWDTLHVILPLQNVDGVVKGGDNNGKYASMIFANETWNKLGEMGLHDLVFLWPNVNAHGT